MGFEHLEVNTALKYSNQQIPVLKQTALKLFMVCMMGVQLRIYHELHRMSLLIRRVKGILPSNIVKNVYQYQHWTEEGILPCRENELGVSLPITMH